MNYKKELNRILYRDGNIDLLLASLPEKIEKIDILVDTLLKENGGAISLGKGETAYSAWMILGDLNASLEKLRSIEKELKTLPQ